MIEGYIAMSADGYVADHAGGVDWLERFGTIDFGFGDFMATVDTVVMGRTTYDQVIAFGGDYPYAGKRSIVVTSNAVTTGPADVIAWHDGIPALAAQLSREDGNAWVVGGAMLQSAFIKAGLLDRLRLFVMPIFLGAGIRLHDADHPPLDLHLTDTTRFEGGAVLLDYRLGR
ncbi:MAG: dihydrofolate reductase family protein [Sphingomonadaceae bacterium]|jgi:dihydrofolate reductase|nr:dihydrofolate reductase family protein [Sphingomonadaceae bacterium]